MRFSLPSISPYISNKLQIEGEILENKKLLRKKILILKFNETINIHNLKFKYPSAKKIFDGVNISIEKINSLEFMVKVDLVKQH